MAEEGKTQSDLPSGWAKKTTPDGKVYYEHAASNKSQWDPPQMKHSQNGLNVKYSFKIGACNNNDLCICTNDVNSARIITAWYESVTGRKVLDQSEKYKFFKCYYILEGARKSSAFDEHFEVPIMDKMMEVGYKFVGCSDRGEVKGSFHSLTLIFVSDFDNL